MAESVDFLIALSIESVNVFALELLPTFVLRTSTARTLPCLSLAYFIDRLHYIGIHAMAYGGIALISFSMMCRVGLGHTDRNVGAKYPVLNLALISFALGVIFRVFFPFIFPEFTRIGMMTSQLFWIFSYCTYIWFYFPKLTKKESE